jgi:hypothetical protein
VGLIVALRLVGRRRGYDNLYAPPQGEPPADQPLRCRLNLVHRWRTMRTPAGDRYQRCADTFASATAVGAGCQQVVSSDPTRSLTSPHGALSCNLVEQD